MGGRVMLKITITWKDNRKGHQREGKRINHLVLLLSIVV